MSKGDRLSRTASVAYTKGLLNNPGENNCFLNSAVQVLWHLDVFRRSFREISGHFCVGESCIFCALKVIFTQIQYSDEAALPPDVLRQALAETFKDEQRFQLQDMDDAAECLENILNRLHFHFAMNERDEICSAPHCISHRKFAMEIMEQSTCNCGATSEPLPFSQLVHYVSVPALCDEADVLSSKFKVLQEDMFGHLLKRAVNRDLRTCPGINCGKQISVQQSLLNCPDVVCIGLIWDSECPEVKQITQLLDCIDPVLRLPEVFPRVVDDTAKKVELLLAGVVTYYGKHYSTFFYSNKLSNWIYFDDARVRKCGSEWETIRKKCCQNHYQPLLLLYVNPHGRAVNTRGAPSEVKLVDTKTLLASQENNRSRTSFASEKTNDRSASSLSVLHEHKADGDGVDGVLSSSSSHSVASDRGSEKDDDSSTSDPKKRSRSMRKLRDFGSDIKRALSRSRNSSPIREQTNGTSDTKSSSSRSRNASPVRERAYTAPDTKRTLSRSRNNSPVREQTNGSSDARRSLSRSRNNSPVREQTNGSSDTRRSLSRSRNNSPVREQTNGASHAKRSLSRSRNNSPAPERNHTAATVSFNAGKFERGNDQKQQQASCDDLINLSDDPKPNPRRAYSSASTRSREMDEVDSGLGSGSSQASSPATSSVSSVDTTTDDLIDFTSKTSTFPRPTRANEVQARLDNMVNEAESLLRRSYDLEKGDLALSLSLATNAATRFRIVVENCPPNRGQTYLANLKNRHNVCLERSRVLHAQITERNNNAARMEFSQREKQKLINSQRERDQQVLREMKQTPAVHGTLPRSPVKDRVQVNEVLPMSSRSINELYVNGHSARSESPSPSRRTNSRSFHSGPVGNSRDDVNCTQKIKPDALCYSPAHYGKTNGLTHDFDRLNVGTQDRSTTVTHVSTSYIPVRSLPIEQMLHTSTVLPNSRNSRNADIRRCSVYDNMPPGSARDSQMYPSAPQRTALPSSYPSNRPYSSSEVRENRRGFNTPGYKDPPPYGAARSAQNASKSQSATLLQRFNVPTTPRYSDTVGVPEDVRRVNEGIRHSRRLCGQCKQTFVEKNAVYCRPCQELNHMLCNLNDTAMQY